jgi:hypothetical protein
MLVKFHLIPVNLSNVTPETFEIMSVAHIVSFGQNALGHPFGAPGSIVLSRHRLISHPLPVLSWPMATPYPAPFSSSSLSNPQCCLFWALQLSAGWQK